MRVKRQKTNKRLMMQYKSLFGFYEPYQVIVDGTFAHVANRFSINLSTQVPKVMMGAVKLFTTPCVQAELKSLGTEYVDAGGLVRRSDLRKCGHSPPVNAVNCADLNGDVTGKTNEHRLIIATQDPMLRSKLREIPGVPMLYLSNSVLILEPHSRATLEYTANQEQGKTQVQEFEKKCIKMLVGEAKAKRQPKTTTVGKMPPRRKVKGPNPLSCKKRKVITDASVDAQVGSKKRKEPEVSKFTEGEKIQTYVDDVSREKKKRRQQNKKETLDMNSNDNNKE